MEPDPIPQDGIGITHTVNPPGSLTDYVNPPNHEKDVGHGRYASPEDCLAVKALMDRGLSPNRIADELHKDTRTVRGIIARLKDPATYAAAILTAGTGHALHAWQQAIPIAAAEGKHQPAKEWLLHAGAIQPVNAGPTSPTVQVVIGVSLHGTASSALEPTAATVEGQVVVSANDVGQPTIPVTD